MLIRSTREPILVQVGSTVMHTAASFVSVKARQSSTTARLFVASHCHVFALHSALPNRRLYPQPG